MGPTVVCQRWEESVSCNAQHEPSSCIHPLHRCTQRQLCQQTDTTACRTCHDRRCLDALRAACCLSHWKTNDSHGKLHANYTRIECWPAIEPKLSSELAVVVGEHPICPTQCQAKRSARNVNQSVRNVNQTVVGQFACVAACDPQSWPVFAPKPEADSVANVGKHPARGALVLLGCRMERS